MDDRWRAAHVRRVLRSRWRTLCRGWSWSEVARGATRAVLHLVPSPTRCRMPRALRYAYGFQISAYAVAFARPRQRKGGNLLVFGAGRDTSTWSLLNRNGRTVILEDDPRWASAARRHRRVEVVLTEYLTTVAESLACTDAADVRLPELPESVSAEQWDVVVVDGPAGSRPGTPGRGAPIVLAARLVAEHGLVMIDDCFRDLEQKMRDLVFERPADVFLDIERPVAVYLASPTDRAEVRAAVARGAVKGGVELCRVDIPDTAEHQDALRRIVGPPGPGGKEELVRVRLNADYAITGGTTLRVEHGGDVLGHVAEAQTKALIPLVESCGGVAHAWGFVVDGWRDDPDRAEYRLRLWIDSRQLGASDEAQAQSRRRTRFAAARTVRRTRGMG